LSRDKAALSSAGIAFIGLAIAVVIEVVANLKLGQLLFEADRPFSFDAELLPILTDPFAARLGAPTITFA
jgi:hypothetical protein